jgi:primosomal protein N' (replication factor Y) (superfamily II helicase)
VATPRLFRLKAEVAPAPSGPVAESLPIARVRVDTGVFHLDQLYDYSVPEKLSSSAVIGVRVQIPFGGRETEGIVVSRSAKAERAGELKSVTKVLSPHPVATTTSLKLFDAAAEFYCCNPWDLIRSAIPPRVAAVDKEFVPQTSTLNISGGGSLPVFQTLSPFQPSHQQIPDLIKQIKARGSILIIAPDEKDVDLLYGELKGIRHQVLRLTSSTSREERYRNFLLSMSIESSIIIGTRSAIFAPVKNLQTIIVYKESSPDHFEIRSPGWSTYAIAKLRAKSEGLQLIFTGFSPSVRCAFDIDQSQMKYRNEKVAVQVQAFAPHDGALLPGRVFTEIKKALAQGPVLFLAPRKGYGNALLCAHCRNIAMCKCGGRLQVASKGIAPTCVHCGTGYPAWKCSFCARDTQYLAGRGIDRAAEEISRAFPGYPVILSAGEVIKEEVESKPSIVLSTPGAQPLVDGGYSAVVVLDAMRFFAHTDISSQERARELLLESASLINKPGKVLLVIDDSHPIVSAIARWNIAPLLKRELADRQELMLPPTVASAVIVTTTQVAPQIVAGLRKALSEGRIPDSVRIFGPTVLPKDQAKVVLHVSHEEWSQLADVLHELQRKRSIAKKDLLNLRVAPYSL